MRNFPLEFVIQHDLPAYYAGKRDTYTGFAIDCPFCGRKHKLDVNISKQFWNCVPCNKGGNALMLHASLCNCDNKAAYKDLMNIWSGLPSDLKAAAEMPAESRPIEKQAPLFIRNYIYRAFLDKLTLSEDHKKALMDRGLSEERIRELGFKDAPVSEVDCLDIFASLARKNEDFREYFLHNPNAKVCGFYDLHTVPKAVATFPGILVPIVIREPLKGNDYCSEEDYISGFQVRYDNEVIEKYPDMPRYSYYVSSKKETGIGFSGSESVHCVLPASYYDEAIGDLVAPSFEKVILTEGGLKADVASYLSNDTPFIAVLGVNMQQGLTETLKKLKRYCGLKEVCVAFDEDYADNPNVADALKEVKRKIESSGLKASECHWRDDYLNNHCKGIDDVLLYRKNRRNA